jgi:excisionase family DNA binding protein
MTAHQSEAVQRGYSIRDVARAGNCCRSKVYDEIKNGRLRARKLGRRTLILANDLSAWLASLPRLNL